LLQAGAVAALVPILIPVAAFVLFGDFALWTMKTTTIAPASTRRPTQIHARQSALI